MIDRAGKDTHLTMDHKLIFIPLLAVLVYSLTMYVVRDYEKQQELEEWLDENNLRNLADTFQSAGNILILHQCLCILFSCSSCFLRFIKIPKQIHSAAHKRSENRELCKLYLLIIFQGKFCS